MRADAATVLAAARTQPIQVSAEVRVVIILHNLDEALKRLLHRLPVVPVPSLQPNCVFIRPQHRNHEGRGTL